MPDNRNRKRPIQVKFFVDEKELSLIKARMAPVSYTHLLSHKDAMREIAAKEANGERVK